MAKLHVYEVPQPTPRVSRPEPVKLETVVIMADGDDARRAAKTMLQERGFAVRSLNWGPDEQGKGNVLHAYVTKGAR